MYDGQGDQILTKEKKKDALSMDGSKKRVRIPREANDDTGMKTHVEPCRSE